MTSRRYTANLLLADIPALDRRRLEPNLEPTVLQFGQVLYEFGQTVRHIYFPIDCLISLLAAVDRRRMLEVGMIGKEGMAGIPLSRDMSVSGGRTLVTGAGRAWRMAAAPFRAEIGRSQPLQKALLRYTCALIAQIAQNAACNRFHTAEARLARWLLTTRDRLGSDEFRLTQEFMANMLGLRRVGITEAASRLKRRKLIVYHRGMIKIQDVKGLVASACSCYRLLYTVHERTRRTGQG